MNDIGIAGCLGIAGSTRRGSHKENEDAFGYRRNSPNLIHVAVVDGAGCTQGNSIGNFSNALVHKALRYLLVFGNLSRCLEILERYASSLAKKKEHAAVLLATVFDDAVHIAWKGDVCAWRIGVDGEVAERLVVPHRTTRGGLTRWIGAESRGTWATMNTSLRPEESLLIATDGTFPNLNPTHMSSYKAETLDALAHALTEGAPEHDDATVVLVRNHRPRNYQGGFREKDF